MAAGRGEARVLEEDEQVAARRQTPARAERAAIETVKVQINGSTLADYQDWEARAGALDDPRDELTGFSAWYAECEAEWIARAREVGLWRQAGRSEKSDARECRRRSETVGHARRDDGLVVHFLVVAEEAATVFRARHCRTVPVFSLGQHWTDEQRLTWEEFIGGASCRGCGRGFVGAPEWKPVLTRSPEEAEAIASARRPCSESCIRTATLSAGGTGRPGSPTAASAAPRRPCRRGRANRSRGSSPTS